MLINKRLKVLGVGDGEKEATTLFIRRRRVASVKSLNSRMLTTLFILRKQEK